MIIAVNTRLRKEQQPEGYEHFLFGILNRLTVLYPQYRFVFIFDMPYGEELSFAKNVMPVITGPETGNSLRLHYWLNYKLPAVLRKHKADVFVSMEGFCSPRTKKPQCLLLTDLCFLRSPLPVKKPLAGFYKKHTASFVAKAKQVATVSEFSKQVLVDHYHIKPGSIEVIRPGIDDIFKPLDWDEKEAIKEKYADGKAYFLFCGDTGNSTININVLKAFTLFKKRLKSNMLLLIAGETDDAFKKILQTYALRNEVKLVKHVSNAVLAEVTAAAYAMIYPVLYTDLAIPALQALQCGVPLISSHEGALPAILGDAALFADPRNINELAQNMILVFKDEEKAKAMVRAGHTLMQQHQLDKAAAILMQLILKAAAN